MLAALGGLVGCVYGWFTYEEEKPVAKVLPFPSCDECAEYA